MKKILIILSGVIVLGSTPACSFMSEPSEQQFAIARQHRAACLARGYSEGSDNYSNCRNIMWVQYSRNS